jgi:hypothetical protein
MKINILSYKELVVKACPVKSGHIGYGDASECSLVSLL